ncbi:MAG: hypothetical protein U9R57_11790 [Thermodesulfobacteriota bacterium]|nr:hypothetical protein [Thermodesulfobacteriota bacterium]
MNKNILSTAVAFLLLTGSSFATDDTTVKEPNEVTAAKILSAVQKFDDMVKMDGYSAKLVSLKEDDSCENPIVFLNGLSGYCGSAGCTLLVMDCNAEGYKVMGKTTVSNRPVSLSASETKGYRDIKVRVRDTGIVVLKHDGKAYTKNASKAPKSKKESSDTMIFDEMIIKQKRN